MALPDEYSDESRAGIDGAPQVDSSTETDESVDPDVHLPAEIGDGEAPVPSETDPPPIQLPDAAEIVLQLERTQTVVERIDATLAAFHQRAAEYEATNRLLHARVEDLQQDQVRSLLKPVFERLASLHAQATEAADSNRDADAASADEFDFFATSINELLALYDIDSVGAAVGQPFDSRKHHGTRIKSTDDPALDGIVQRIHRQGYKLAGSGRVLLPARVSVYRYAAEEAPSGAAALA